MTHPVYPVPVSPGTRPTRMSVQSSASDVTLDPQKAGRVFEGLGAVSAGASSRLLIDYPEPQRSEILDYLFKPNYGAALQHLKVEIGGGINSTDGTEPSHMRTRTDEDYTRGYEWWLMKEARGRNPAILLDCLAWGAPGWIGNGNYFSQDMANYVAKFLLGAKQVHGLDINYTGMRNESGYSPNWIKLLRATLDTNGLQAVRIVAPDNTGAWWPIISDLNADPALAAAVDALAIHYVAGYSPIQAQALGIPIWSSEDGIGGNSWHDAIRIADIYNRNYLSAKATKTEIWSPITSYYDNLGVPASGLMRATTPWSGYYEVSPAIWVTAHTTQFAQLGWVYLEGGATTTLPNGGTVVSLKSTNQVDYSVVVETAGASINQTVNFHLVNGLSTGPVAVWRTTTNEWFVLVEQVTPVNGTFQYTFLPGSVYTLTTTTGQAKGTATPPAPSHMALPYQDDFESYAVGATPWLFSDQAATFEVAQRTDGQGQCLRQVLTQKGIQWSGDYNPYSIMGDQTWRDYEVSADVWLEQDGVAFVLGRVGRVTYSSSAPHAYYLAVDSAAGRWELGTAYDALAFGTVPIPINTWHSLRLAMQGNQVQAWVDNVLVADVIDSSYPWGMVGLGCGWHGAQFDNFVIRRRHRGAPNLAEGATASASSQLGDDFRAALAIDAEPGTRWMGQYPANATEWLELDFPQPTRFNHTTYSEFGTRISGYGLQHWSGTNWVADVIGGSMGGAWANMFPTVTSTKVRLFFNQNQFVAMPGIFEFGVYDETLPANLPIRINEWMVNNTRTVADPADGRFKPWFELYNAGATDVDLAGYYLSNLVNTNALFQIPPDYHLPPGGYLLVWADEDPSQNQPGQSDLHVNFTLANSRLISLSTPDGRLLDAVDLDPQPPDLSSGSRSRSDRELVTLPLARPTPRGRNDQIVAVSLAQRTGDGLPLIEFSGFPFAAHRIQYATDISHADWTDTGTATAGATGTLRFVDSSAAGSPQRFYRAAFP